MDLRAICVAGLVMTAAAAQEASVSGDAVVHRAIEASAEAWSAGGGNTPAVRWDGHAVSQDDHVRGLRESSRRTMETWRQFAERRGYRVDLDETQRVIVISDSERFESFASSERIVDRALDRMEEFENTVDAGPLVVLRARSADDAAVALQGATALGVNQRLEIFEETGSLKDVRAVNARLAETVVRTHLHEHQPFLSDWMVDGISSLVAAEVTGRAMVDGKAVSLRSVLSQVSRAHKHDLDLTINLMEIGGQAGDGTIMEAEAMAVISFLDDDILSTIVPELGQRGVSGQTAKFRQEEEALLSHVGKTALQDLQDSLERGK